MTPYPYPLRWSGLAYVSVATVRLPLTCYRGRMVPDSTPRALLVARIALERASLDVQFANQAALVRLIMTMQTRLALSTGLLLELDMKSSLTIN
jgi:hypothetical protein